VLVVLLESRRRTVRRIHRNALKMISKRMITSLKYIQMITLMIRTLTAATASGSEIKRRTDDSSRTARNRKMRK